jgi:hypothetical protein
MTVSECWPRTGSDGSTRAVIALQNTLSARRRLVLLLVAGFGLAGALELLVLTRTGLGLSPDSINYLSAAESVTSTGTFHGFELRDRYALYAPLYPLLLAPGAALDASLGEARVLGAIVFGLLSSTAVLGALRITSSLAFAACTGTAALLSIPLLHVNSYVWSDGLFALLSALFLLAVTQLGEGRGHGATAISGLLVAAAVSTRYIGVTLIPVGLVAIGLWSDRRRRDVPLFLGLAALGFLWTARNVLVTSTLGGHRNSAAEGLWTAIRDSGRTVGTWLQPAHPSVALAVAALVAVFALSTLRRRPAGRLEVVSFLFCAIYLVWLNVSAASVVLDPIDDRFLAAIYVPTLWIAVAVASRLASIAPSGRGHVATAVVLVACFGAWAVFQGRRIPDLSDRVTLSTIHDVARWTEDDEARARDISTRLYSNAPDYVYLQTGTRASYTPRRSVLRSDDPLDELTPLRSSLSASGPVALVWFPAVHRADLDLDVYTPAELGRRVEVRLVARTAAAELYSLSCPCTEARKQSTSVSGSFEPADGGRG